MLRIGSNFHSPAAGSTAPTIDAPAAAPGGGRCRMIAGATPQITAEITALLRRRLAQATSIAAAAVSLFLLRMLLVDNPFELHVGTVIFRSIVAVGMIGLAALLWSRKPLDLCRLRDFELPLAPRGTVFEGRVWAAMQAIPYGETRSYGDLAGATGSAPRAVGRACGKNPIPIVIPCHRVLAKAGLGGYSGDGGLATKQRLLAVERAG